METRRKKEEVQVAVVDASWGLHSDIWKFKSHGSEIYIISRSLGGELKTSLHSSGKARHAFFSQEKSARWREPGLDRAITKWQSPWVDSETPTWRLLAEIIIPETSLQTSTPPTAVAKRGLVMVQAPPIGWITCLCLIEIVSVGDARATTSLRSIGQMAVGGRRVCVAAYYAKLTKTNREQLAEVRERIETHLRSGGTNIQLERGSAMRSVLYLGSNDGIGRLVDLDVSDLFRPTGEDVVA